MPDFRMRAIHATIQLAIKNDPTADPGADGHIDESLLAATCSPGSFAEGRSVTVILQRHTHVERAGQIVDGIAALPGGQKIHVTKCSGEGMHPTGRADA